MISSSNLCIKALSSSATMNIELYSRGPSGNRMMVRLASTSASTNDAIDIEVGDRWKSGSSRKNFAAAITVLVLPTPGCPTRNTYRLGYKGADVCSQTFCSSTADRVAIAAHLRKMVADSRFAAWSTKLAIQEADLRAPLALVVPLVVLKAIPVFL